MARKRATSFTPPTEADAQQTPDLVIRAPHGALMWSCDYCRRPASSETLKGKKVCRVHGGSTPAQRDPLKRKEAEQRGETPGRPPGRPIKLGLYSRSPGVRIDEIVADYQARKINPDATDEDMLYLRAYVEDAKSIRLQTEVLLAPLQELEDRLRSFLSEAVPEKGSVTVEGIIGMLDRGREFATLARSVRALLKQVQRERMEIEARHVKLIQLSKVRAEARLKDSAASQLTIFSMMLGRFKVVLREQLSPADMDALQRRIDRELSKVPQRALEGGS